MVTNVKLDLQMSLLDISQVVLFKSGEDLKGWSFHTD